MDKMIQEAEKTGVDEAAIPETAATETVATAAPPSPEVTRLEAEITALEKKLEDKHTEFLYAQAEIQNVRRRADDEIKRKRAEDVKRFAKDILSVADNLTRALSAIPAEIRDDERLTAVITGLEATGRELDAIFTRHGIAKIVAEGCPLDPNLHEAMMAIPTDSVAPGIVMQEIQTGYTINHQLLRPAKVAVAKKPDA